jgi:O-acetyl-ADP-ribose deacetylase (regulator of RNase III)
MTLTIGTTTLSLLQGDITRQDTDAIVNAANSSLLGGGGVDGAIHTAGGSQILEECRAIRAKQGECSPGQAVITSGGRLKARFVIHTVGPVWYGGSQGEEQNLGSAYESSLRLALENGIKTIAFPSISTGAYGFPIERASRIALRTVSEFVRNQPGVLEEVRFVVFSERDKREYEEAMKEEGEVLS